MIYDLDHSSMEKDRIDAQNSDDDGSHVDLKDTDRLIKGNFSLKNSEVIFSSLVYLLQTFG